MRHLLLHIESRTEPGLYCGATIVKRLTLMTRGGPERGEDKTKYCRACLEAWTKDGKPKYVTDASGGYYK